MGQWLSSENQLLIDGRAVGKNYMTCDGDDPNSSVCAVYCSSNGIYFPNDDETFIKRIVQQNKYDWKTNRFEGVRKHIYIRDVQKQWYVEGINESVNSIPEIAELIRSEAWEGAKFVFLGSSAGGYMAIVLASILGGVVFAGSPQIVLECQDKNWLVKKYWDDERKNKYFDLVPVIRESDAEIYIFYGNRNAVDVSQLQALHDVCNVHLIPFDTDAHGVCFYPFCARYFLNSTLKLNKMASTQKVYTRFSFSVRLCGALVTLKHCFITILKKFR